MPIEDGKGGESYKKKKKKSGYIYLFNKSRRWGSEIFGIFFFCVVVVLPSNFRLTVAIDSQTEHCHHHQVRLRRGSVFFSFPIDTTPSLDDDGQSVMFRWRVVRDKPVAPIISSLSAKTPPFFSNVYLRKRNKGHTHTYNKKKINASHYKLIFQEVRKNEIKRKRKSCCVWAL